MALAAGSPAHSAPGTVRSIRPALSPNIAKPSSTLGLQTNPPCPNPALGYCTPRAAVVRQEKVVPAENQTTGEWHILEVGFDRWRVVPPWVENPLASPPEEPRVCPGRGKLMLTGTPQ